MYSSDPTCTPVPPGTYEILYILDNSPTGVDNAGSCPESSPVRLNAAHRVWTIGEPDDDGYQNLRICNYHFTGRDSHCQPEAQVFATEDTQKKVKWCFVHRTDFPDVYSIHVSHKRQFAWNVLDPKNNISSIVIEQFVSKQRQLFKVIPVPPWVCV